MITGNRSVVTFKNNLLVGVGYTRAGQILQRLVASPRKTLTSGTCRPVMGADDYLPGEVQLDFLFDPSYAVPEPSAPNTFSAAAAEELTIVYQLQEGAENEAELTGSGFASQVGYPGLLNDRLAIAQLTFQFDGITPPEFTPET